MVLQSDAMLLPLLPLLLLLLLLMLLLFMRLLLLLPSPRHLQQHPHHHKTRHHHHNSIAASLLCVPNFQSSSFQTCSTSLHLKLKLRSSTADDCYRSLSKLASATLRSKQNLHSPSAAGVRSLRVVTAIAPPILLLVGWTRGCGCSGGTLLG